METMTMTPTLTADKLVELFSFPIRCIQQVAWKSGFYSSTNKWNAWGGTTPIFTICFEVPDDLCLFIAATDKSLVLRLSHVEDVETIADIVNQIDEEGYPEDHPPDELLGFFDLNSVVCPVPEWAVLSTTKVSVISSGTDNDVIGICIWINLGTRIGLFVNPYPGITLSFNDTCDLILKQAEIAQREGVLKIVTKEYPGTQTPKQIDTIDWFDWLRSSTGPD